MRTARNRSERKTIIEKKHPKLSICRQSQLLGVNRNRREIRLGKMDRSDTELIRLIDEIHMECSFYRQRQLRNELRKLGHNVGRFRVRRLMKLMGLGALCSKPSTSKRCPEHKVYPYLLRDGEVTELDQVCCSDITYIPMPQGHC